LGTSSFTAAGWDGTFYPKGMRSADYLSFYAQHFHTVEVDSTFYGCPSARTVSNWAARTPDSFLFSVKAPQIITHEKVLVDCDEEIAEFLTAMDILGPKLGPIVFQFPFFDHGQFARQEDFVAVLSPFLTKLPRDHKFAVEIRNKAWLDAGLADLLRQHKVALVFADLPYMPGPAELSRKFDPITADWTYIRWLGDRKGIEEQTTNWDKPIVDRTAELTSWVDYCYQIRQRGVIVFAYANNHYAGHAPATISQFLELWRKKGFPELAMPARQSPGRTLFDDHR
jgi:uncharacterized protein YecE (DUF72 family)